MQKIDPVTGLPNISIVVRGKEIIVGAHRGVDPTIYRLMHPNTAPSRQQRRAAARKLAKQQLAR
jgi:hypothetical protein